MIKKWSIRYPAVGGEEERRAMGERGRIYYEANFTKQRHMDHLEALLKELAGEEPSCGYFS